MYVKRAAVTSVSAGGRKPAAILSSLVAVFNVVSAATKVESRVGPYHDIKHNGAWT